MQVRFRWKRRRFVTREQALMTTKVDESDDAAGADVVVKTPLWAWSPAVDREIDRFPIALARRYGAGLQPCIVSYPVNRCLTLRGTAAQG